MLTWKPCKCDLLLSWNQHYFDLKPERFKALTRRDTLGQVFEGIESVGRVGFSGLKLDTVAMKGFNDDELIPLIEYGKRVNGEVRFIEYTS